MFRSERASLERLTFEIPVNDAANGIYAAMKAEVERRGGRMSLDEQTRQHILRAALWLTDATAPPGLMLCGLCGNGKTTLARALATLIEFITEKEMSFSNRCVMKFQTARNICRLCAAGEKYKEESAVFRSLFHEPMLIIDDLGQEPQEVVVYGMVHNPIVDLITERYDRRLMTVITSNLETEDIRRIYGERLFDRMKEMFVPVIFENESFRKMAVLDMDRGKP